MTAGASGRRVDVQQVGLSASELLVGGSWNQQLTIDSGRRFVTDAVVHCHAITQGFFDTLGVQVVSAAGSAPPRSWRPLAPTASALSARRPTAISPIQALRVD